jgi:hypothetical protein
MDEQTQHYRVDAADGSLYVILGNGVPVKLGDWMHVAATICRVGLYAEMNTRMGTSEHKQKAKLNRIRKAIGFTS